MSDDEFGELRERHARRTRIVAWSVIISMLLMGGGATVFTLLFG